MIHENIKNSVKPAMLAKETEKLEVIRGMLTAFTNELVAKKRKPDEWLGDEETLSVIRRLAKQREDAAQQFRAGGRLELAEKEERELLILKTYLPAPMPETEVRKIAEQKKATLGIASKADAGKLIGAVMKETGNRADGNVVKQIVDELLR